MSRDGLLHPKCRTTSANGVIFVSDRRTEESHNAVAHDPANGALVAVNCLDHEFEHRIEDPLRGFWVPVSKELHGTRDIGEQNGDLFALALRGYLCG
jgi:hypothetical protein